MGCMQGKQIPQKYFKQKVMREEDENNRSGTKTVNNTVEPSIFISDDNSGGKTLPAKLKRSDSTAQQLRKRIEEQKSSNKKVKDPNSPPPYPPKVSDYSKFNKQFEEEYELNMSKELSGISDNNMGKEEGRKQVKKQAMPKIQEEEHQYKNSDDNHNYVKIMRRGEEPKKEIGKKSLIIVQDYYKKKEQAQNNSNNNNDNNDEHMQMQPSKIQNIYASRTKGNQEQEPSNIYAKESTLRGNEKGPKKAFDEQLSQIVV